MGRPRIVRKAEEAKAVPADQPIQVELPPEGVVELTDPPESVAPLGVKPPEKPVIPAKTEPVVEKPEPKEPEEDVTSLKAQLAEIKKSAEEARKRAEEASAREAAFRQRYEKEQEEFRTATTRAGQAELDAVNNAIAAATSELASAKSDLKTAGDAGDWNAIAEAQERIAEAKTRVVQLGDAKAHLTERAERLKNMKPEQLAPAGDPIENYINSLQGTTSRQKDWLRSHRDVLSDNRKFVKLQAAHFDAEEQELDPSSDEYFKFIEEHMGYRKPVKPVEEEPEVIESQPAIVSAPPSREAPSASTGRPTTTRITLTAAQREAAANAGISEIEYARQLLVLQQRKKEGLYTEH